MNNQSVVGAFNRGRAKNRETHALLDYSAVVRVASGVRIHAIVEVDPEGGQRGRRCHFAAFTRRHHPHIAGIVPSGLGRYGPF